MQRLPRGRFDHGHHDAGWRCDDVRDRRNDVNRVERQDGRVFVIEDLLVVARDVLRQGVGAEVPMDEERFVPVLLLFVDVFRRSDGNPSHRGHEDKPDQPAP